MFILNVKGFIKIKANFSLVYVIMTLVIEMKKIVIKENDANQRIDKYLKKLLCNAPSNFIYKMFRKKDIKINGKKVNEKYILQKDDILEMFLDKPVGLLVHGDAKENVNTLSHQVLSYLKEKGELDVGRESTFTPGPVHRLDRNTSGIVIFGKTLAALQDLNEMMKKRHHIEKSYMTICKGKLTKQQELVGYVKKIDNEDRVRFVKKDDKDALMMKTIVKPIRTTNDFSLVEVKIITGRMHQIRIHLSSIDHPVIGDRKYGDFALNKQMKQQFGLNNQLLHAYKINFVDPFGSLSYLKGKIIICPKPTQFKKIEKSLFESVL